MAKIIQFNKRKKEDANIFFKENESLDKWYIQQTILLNIHGNNYNHKDSFERLMRDIEKEDVEMIMKYATDFYRTKGEKETLAYLQALQYLKSKYSPEVLRNAKAN